MDAISGSNISLYISLFLQEHIKFLTLIALIYRIRLFTIFLLYIFIKQWNQRKRKLIHSMISCKILLILLTTK